MSNLYKTRVSLRPETLPAIYTPTQATQEAILRPGMFTEVNLGVAAFGIVTGAVLAADDEEKRQAEKTLGRALGEPKWTGVSNVRVILVDGDGKIAANSITGADGSYYLGDVRPGKYTVQVDETTLPPDFVLETKEQQVEVLSGIEPPVVENVNLLGRYTVPREKEPETKTEEGIEYKIFK
ncbi:MAG: SdrD B-like domain-containing protein [Candidatus Eisenbacteria bacterium]|nr:SdrD B-like domain-containing protein [Candidatus Eisenbacteria bacterium]